MLTIREELGLRPFLTVHDSLSYLVPEDDAEQAAGAMIDIAERVLHHGGKTARHRSP
jgi:hypothetical protein